MLFRCFVPLVAALLVVAQAFDPSAFSLREVGGRNTLVSLRSHRIVLKHAFAVLFVVSFVLINSAVCCLPSGLEGLARATRTADFLLARRSSVARRVEQADYQLCS